jgi:hypothetical protein
LENPEDEEAYQKLLTEWINTMHGIWDSTNKFCSNWSWKISN